MKNKEVWWILGGLAALALFVAWQGGAFNDGLPTTTAASNGIGIDPSTGGVALPGNQAYGPAVPLPSGVAGPSPSPLPA